MGKSQETFNKKEREKKRMKKRLEKQEKRDERKANSEGGALENMLAYIDENGNITDTPPDPAKKKKIDLSSIPLGVPKREKDETDAVLKGKVDFFDHCKGFGFIKVPGTNDRYFVHVNGLIDKIEEGDTVTFELERGMKGMNSVRVKKV
ncbi:MAG: cold shock domain-containing protein [Bacteroidia bacterium]